jgi:hypothetical protein
MSTYQIFQAWQHKELFLKADVWLTTVEDGAEWNWKRGRSTINGVEYPAAVNIEHEEDLLAFKLKFGELLR